MKRILASLFVTSVAICSASAANAQLTNEATSIHSGTVAPACTVEATPGTLRKPANIPVPSSIDSSASGDLGSFKMICNSTHSLTVAKQTTGTTAIVAGLDYKEEFRLIGTGDYSTLTSSFAEAYTTVSGLAATGSAGRTVSVAARASVGSAYVLPKGDYIINIKATATAN
jgi:hypothetical protein